MTREHRDPPAKAGNEETTPVDGMAVDGADGSPLVTDEGREFDTPDAGPVEAVGFDTVPGGGMNRLSGGRSAARAYVRPKTPPPAIAAADQRTISIDVEEIATGEGRAFATVPSIGRRRLKEREIDSLPPLAPGRPTPVSRVFWVVAALFALGAAYYFFGRSAAPVVDQHSSSTEPLPASTSSPAPAQPASATSPAPAAPTVQPTTAPPAPTAASAAPAAAPAAPVRPTTSSGPPASRAPSKPADSDPWLQ